MFTGITNALAVTALIAFINAVYARPWEQDERALLLPGIVGAVIGYAIGAWIGKHRWWYWWALLTAAILSVVLSWTYNELLLQEEAESLYGLPLYLCFSLMNLAAFCVFGVIGWTFVANGGKNGKGE
jgi:MFS family permease